MVDIEKLFVSGLSKEKIDKLVDGLSEEAKAEIIETIKSGGLSAPSKEVIEKSIIKRKDVTTDILMNLIEINEKNRPDEMRKTIAPAQYLKEYCTVVLFAGRKRGHSTAVATLFNKPLENFSLFIYPNSGIGQTHIENFNIKSSTDKDAATTGIVTYYRYYIVDMAFMWSRKETEQLYLNIANLKEFKEGKEITLIFVG